MDWSNTLPQRSCGFTKKKLGVWRSCSPGLDKDLLGAQKGFCNWALSRCYFDTPVLQAVKAVKCTLVLQRTQVVMDSDHLCAWAIVNLICYARFILSKGLDRKSPDSRLFLLSFRCPRQRTSTYWQESKNGSATNRRNHSALQSFIRKHNPPYLQAKPAAWPLAPAWPPAGQTPSSSPSPSGTGGCPD